MGDSILIKRTPHNIFILGTRNPSTEVWRLARREGDDPLKSPAIVFMFYWTQLTFRSLSGSFKHEWGVKSMLVMSAFFWRQKYVCHPNGASNALFWRKKLVRGLKQDMLRALWFVCWLLNGCQRWSRFNIVSDSVWQVAGCNSHTVV